MKFDLSQTIPVYLYMGVLTMRSRQGNTPDISEWIQHSWYDLVCYQDIKDRFPLDEGEKLDFLDWSFPPS